MALGSLQPRRAQSLNGLRFRMSELGIRLYASDVRRGLADESYHVRRGSRFRFVSYSQAGCAACTFTAGRYAARRGRRGGRSGRGSDNRIRNSSRSLVAPPASPRSKSQFFVPAPARPATVRPPAPGAAPMMPRRVCARAVASPRPSRRAVRCANRKFYLPVRDLYAVSISIE